MEFWSSSQSDMKDVQYNLIAKFLTLKQRTIHSYMYEYVLLYRKVVYKSFHSRVTMNTLQLMF